MKKIIIPLAGAIVAMSASAQSTEQEISTAKVESKTSSSFESKSIELSAAYVNSQLTYANGEEDKIGGNGINLQTGYLFHLSPSLTTTSGLRGNYLILEEKDWKMEHTKIRSYDVGVAQRFSYNINLSGVIIRPFIEGGFSRGRIHFSEDYSGTAFTGDFKMTVDYNKYGGAAGLQFVVSWTQESSLPESDFYSKLI